MCYTKEASKKAFIIGITSSILLILFGNQRILQLIGILFMFISSMQFIDYMIWSDIDCKNGYNKMASKLGFILILLQPLLVCLLFSYNSPYKHIIMLINILYFIYGLSIYVKYIKRDNICSKFNNGRTKWDFSIEFNNNYLGILYISLLVINILLLARNKYAILSVCLVFIGSIISIINYTYHFGEFWCYFSTLTPLIILIVNKLNLL